MAETKTVNGVTLEKLVDTSQCCDDCAAVELNMVSGVSCGGFCEARCGWEYIWKPVSIVPRAKEEPTHVSVASSVKYVTPVEPKVDEYGRSLRWYYIDDQTDNEELVSLAVKVLNTGFGVTIHEAIPCVEHEGKTYLLGPEITLNEGLQEAIEQKAIARQAESKLSEEEKQALKQMWGVAK